MKTLRSHSTIALSAAAGLLTLMLTLAVGSPSIDAQQTTCPAGSVLSDDGASCVSAPSDSDESGVNDNVVTTTSCLQGVLSDDGQTCIVPRLDAPPAASAPVEAPVPTFTG